MFSSQLLDRLSEAQRVVVLTGAGVSAESGIPTFRDQDGIWAHFRPEDLATPEAFERNPQRVWSWYQTRRTAIFKAQPNAGHRALAELERLVPALTIVTQNIDGLHTQAGSTDVIELHGNLRRNYCHRCRREYDDPALLTVEEVPHCACGGHIRPGIVWFNELLPEDALQRAETLAGQADIFFSIGTSAVVYPAAGLPEVARDADAMVVEINPEPTTVAIWAPESIRATSGQALPTLVQALRQHKSRLAGQPER